MKFIPVNAPDLNGREREYLNQCIDTGWISSEGPFVSQLENGFANSVGRKHGIAVCNGTAGLLTALRALQLKDGDEVIVPTFSIVSCTLAIISAGLKPVLVDSRADTWNMDPSAVVERIGPRTKAIMVVHTYGLPVDMDAIENIAKTHGLLIVEDAAEMLGQTYNGKPCGSFGKISVFSTYANKVITTGEGGVIVVDDDDLAERCRSLRNLCFSAGRRFVHEELGYNFRMTNLQAAVGVAQLERLEQFVKRKRHVGNLYQKLLNGVPGLELPLSETAEAENIYWVFGVVVKDDHSEGAPEVMKRLAEKGIGTRPFFLGMHEQPVFQRMHLFESERFPVSERLARQGFYLPSGLALTDDDVDYVAATVWATMSTKE